MLVSTILSDVAHTLIDEGMDTYTMPRLVASLNNACRLIATLRHDACVVTSTVSLQAGTLQYIPDGGQKFLGATRNMLAGGRSGIAVQLKTVADKNRIRPEWHTDPEEYEVLEVMPDEHDPLSYWNYPPVKAGTLLEIRYAAMPEAVGEGDSFPLLDKYALPAKHWVLFEMFSRDTNSTSHAAKAEMNKNVCLQLLGLSTQADGAAAARVPE